MARRQPRGRAGYYLLAPAAEVAALMDVGSPRRQCSLHDGGSRRLGGGMVLLQSREPLLKLRQLSLTELRLVNHRAVLEEVVQEIVLLPARAAVPGELNDLGPLELPFTEMAAPDQSEHFPLTVPDVVLARVGRRVQQLLLPLPQ